MTRRQVGYLSWIVRQAWRVGEKTTYQIRYMPESVRIVYSVGSERGAKTTISCKRQAIPIQQFPSVQDIVTTLGALGFRTPLRGPTTTFTMAIFEIMEFTKHEDIFFFRVVDQHKVIMPIEIYFNNKQMQLDLSKYRNVVPAQ